jgi:membrane protease YdiL (CAAX protease family)
VVAIGSGSTSVGRVPFTVGIVAAIVEELVFRGVIQRGLEEQAVGLRETLAMVALAIVVSLLAARAPWSLVAVAAQILPAVSRALTGRLSTALIARLGIEFAVMRP